MAWVQTTRALLKGPGVVRNYKYLVFIAHDKEAGTADDGAPCYIVCVPDINNGLATEGFGVEDAYGMGRDAASLILNDIPAWKRPQASPYNRARAKVDEAFEGIDEAQGLEWHGKWVKMLVPYDENAWHSKYCIRGDE